MSFFIFFQAVAYSWNSWKGIFSSLAPNNETVALISFSLPAFLHFPLLVVRIAKFSFFSLQCDSVFIYRRNWSCTNHTKKKLKLECIEIFRKLRIVAFLLTGWSKSMFSNTIARLLREFYLFIYIPQFSFICLPPFTLMLQVNGV